MELKTAPDNPSMTKPIALTLHLSDQRGQPVNGATVTGTLTMKTMDMGTTAVPFASRGNGDYQATLKAVDMSGPWSLAVEASQGGASAKHAFEINVGD